MITLQFDWPPKQLSPNAREYWRNKAEYVKVARAMGRFAAVQWLEDNHPEPLEGALEVQYHFSMPDNRKRDLDNCHACMKGYQDGVCDALGINDAQIEIVEIRRVGVRPPGMVTMVIMQADTLQY
jgi:Holliday junction resolvase RusA-like endonuclease